MNTKQKELDFLQYKILVASINDVVFRTDSKGNWIFLNESWARIMEFSVEESISKLAFSFLDPDVVAINVALFEPMIAGTKESCSHEIKYITKSGNVCWMKVFAMLVKDEFGNIVGTQGTLQDITIDMQNREMRKLAEIQIMQSVVKEKELSLLKSNFVSLASHEFRTPLAIMRSSIELSEIYIQNNQLEEPYLLKHINTVTNQIDQLTELIEKVLTLGRIDSKDFTCKKEKVDLVSLIQVVIAMLERIQQDERTVGISVRGTNRKVMADPLLLAHAITNLLSNALKYSVNSREPNIQIVFTKNDYSIIITDFGLGIPLNAKNKVFEAFYRADNVKDIQGTGLGTFIAKKVILLHNGTVSFTSVLNEGTVFTINMN